MQRCRRIPSHNCTPIIPKIKKTKKQSKRTLPSIGKVSNSSITRIRIPANIKTRPLVLISLKIRCKKRKDFMLLGSKECWGNYKLFVLLGILLMALSGLRTRIVRIAVRFRFSTCIMYSRRPASTMKKSKRFQESAK